MALNNGYIEAFWYSSNNFGDNLNHYLIKELSGKIPVLVKDRRNPHYIVCGSILGEFTEGSMIWGAGFFYDHQLLHFDIPVYAVRGELTRGQIKKDVPVGDPALLLPLLYDSNKNKKNRIGIIPHWSNVKTVIDIGYNVHVIDPFKSTKDFIDDVVSCECVFSESLHGLIVADAYNIPNMWIDLGADIGDGYKFKDYYSTVVNPPKFPMKTLNEKYCIVHNYKYNLQELLHSCPFKK